MVEASAVAASAGDAAVAASAGNAAAAASAAFRGTLLFPGP